MTQTFVELLDELAAADPDRPALTCDEATLTRAELRDASRRLAATWADTVSPGDYVSIALPNSPEFLVAAVAAWRLGAVPQPLSPRMARPELEAIADLVSPAGVVGSEIAGHLALPLTAEGYGDVVPVRPVSPYWKAPTSGGSTGRPKVIVANAPATVEAVMPFGELLLMPTDDTVLVPGPLHHNAPFMFTSVALLRGNHVVLQGRFDPERTLTDLQQHGASWMYAVPTMMQRIWRLEPEVRERYDLGALRHVVHMAAPCPPWLKRAWIDWLGAPTVVEIYAGTEAQAGTRIDGAQWLERPASVGQVVFGEMQVLDDDGTPVAPGTVGRIWMRRSADGEQSYFYVGAEANARDGGWECLGDLGYLDADGFVFLTDRDSDMVIVGGSNVYPAEVEAAIDEHPAVLSSCVIGLPHADLGSVPHAIVQTSHPVADDELAGFLRERLSPYKVPRSFEYVTESLRDDAGKVRRSALRAARLEVAR